MDKYKNLIISGGGFNGFQFFGIIKYLDENNLINNIDKYIGVSMGAMINLLIILGYKFNEIENFLIKFNFSKVFDLKFEKILIEDNIKGLSDGNKFNKLIKKFLVNKKFDENITLKQLYEKTNKQLMIGVTNLTKDLFEIMTHENYPDIPVYLAIRMSSCIPMFFEPIEYQDNYYVDGVMKDNFPIQIIPDDELNTTIGMVLLTNQDNYNIKDMSSVNYMIHLYRVLVSEPMKDKINKYKQLCKLFIIQPKINSYNYELDESIRTDLICTGYDLCKASINEPVPNLETVPNLERIPDLESTNIPEPTPESILESM